MPNSVCNDSRNEIENLQFNAEDNLSPTDKKIGTCRRTINNCKDPSPKTTRMIKKIELMIEKEKKNFTKEKVERCRESNRTWLATGKRETVDRGCMALFNENRDSASDSRAVQECRKQIEEQFHREKEKIKVLLNQKA